jgi:transketolase
MALGMRLEGSPARVWVLIGDSEAAEGSVWEAMEAAAHHEVSNLTCVLDLNRLGQRGPTMHGWDADVFTERARAYGWHALSIDGHDVAAIDAAYRSAVEDERPTMIVAKTEKGHGVSEIANEDGWHGKALPPDLAARAIEELGGERSLTITPPAPEPWIRADTHPPAGAAAPTYAEPIATRKAFGETLRWLAGERDGLVVLDGEVGNSTYTEDVEAVAPERFFQMYIAETTMIGAQTGLHALGKIAFSATFGAFLTRAYDQIRMAAIGRADLRLCGSHAGVSIGEDGPSQMALEDLAALRAIHGTTVLYPADGNATVRLVTAMADLHGISYVRTTREGTPVLYGPDEDFPIGGSKTVRDGGDVTIVGAGITLHESLRAAERLAAGGIEAQVLDCYCVKPIDASALRRAAAETGLLVVVEDHRIEGGLGDAVLDALAGEAVSPARVIKLAVTEMPGSGAPEELRAWAGIDADAIVRAVEGALDRSS